MMHPMKKKKFLFDLTGVSLSAEQHALFHRIENTHDNYILQGQAGTGKSTFIKYLFNNSDKKIRILCPTAIAALNISGVTLHSLFQLPLSDFIVKEQIELKKIQLKSFKRQI